MQLELGLRKSERHGGKRPGAGRKPSSDSGIPHLRRPELAARHPVHVTLRAARGCWNLRSHRALFALEGAFQAGRDRFGFRLVHYSVQGNHIHLLVEAEGRESLARGMKGLEVRIARALNRMMRRKGPVFSDRYHARALKTPREAARALRYVLMNHLHHARGWGEALPSTFADPCSSIRYLATAPGPGAPVALPRTWLLRVGWLVKAMRPRAPEERQDGRRPFEKTARPALAVQKRRPATTAQTASTAPNGQAPWRKP